jgi:hypothetical protein
MKKLFYTFALVAFTLISCDKNETDNGVMQQNISTTITDEANRQARPVILGDKINNPYSLKNMQAALDTLKAHPEEQSSCMKAPSSTLENIVIEPTDLYVRFLPADSIQFVKLMADTTLILFDYPLDYEKIQTGDYYKDPTVTGKYTWLYTTVPLGFQPPEGVNYEVIEEVFIPEHSPYYSVEGAPAKVKAINHIKSNVVKQGDYTDALKTIAAISFINTGNADKLNSNTTQSSPTGMQKAISYVKKTFLWKTWYETVYNPEGCFTVSTPRGNLPLANVRIRVARYLTFYETRTDATGRFYFNNQFGQDAVFPNVEYFVYFDGVNGSNSWKLMNELGGTTYTSVGVHSPDRYDMTFYPSSDYWGKCVQQHAISKYIDISRTDGLNLPPSELKIDPEENSDYSNDIPLFVNHLNYGAMLTNIDFELQYKNVLNDFYKISAFAWHQLTHGSLVNRMKSTFGKDWATDYWTTLKDNTCSQQQFGLVVGWATYREDELLNQIYGTIPSYYLNNSESKSRINWIVKDYITMFRDLRAINCSYQSLEKALCSKSLIQFRDNLIALYPNIKPQITSIVQNVLGNITFMTYNLKRDDYDSGYDLLSTRIYNLSSVIKSTNPDVVAIQEIENTRTLNFDILKMETGLDGETLLTEWFLRDFKKVFTYGIGILWKPSLGTPKISNIRVDTYPEESPIIIAEFNDFYFISTHYHGEYNKISDEIISFAKSVNKPVYIGGDFNMNFNAEDKDPALMKLIENGFVVFNKSGDITSSSGKNIDLLIGYKENTTEYNIISKGIPVFPDPNWYIDKKTSDHLPYYVTITL